MLEVYIEADGFTDPKFMEVSGEAPIARIIPALVQELGLPRNDVAGKPLVYLLRRATDGMLLPPDASLRATETQPGTYLTLEVASPAASSLPLIPPIQAQAPALVHAGRAPQGPTHAPTFYTDQTIVSAGLFSELGSAPSLPATPRDISSGAPVRRQRRWTRRALLMAGGAMLGATGIGLGYAAMHGLRGNLLTFVPTLSHAPLNTQSGATPAPQAALPTRASALLVFAQHQQTVRTVAWSPDGTRLASGANDKLVLIWDLTGQVRLRKAQEAPVHALVWSPDAHQLAAASAQQFFLFDAQTGVAQAPAAHIHHATITALAWSPRQPQLLVSVSLDKLAVVWNMQTLQPQVRFRQHSTPILGVDWTSDGQSIATSSEGGVIRVWSGLDGQQLHGLFFDGAQAMTCVACEPMGTRLVVGGLDGVLRLWQNGLTCQLEGQGQCQDKPTRLTGHTGPLRTVAWSPAGRLLASAGDDAQVLIWYPAQSTTPILKISQAAPVQALAWSPDGSKIAVATGKAVMIWALA